MSVSVSMPQLGESVTEGTVTRWLKREGDHVSADEPLLEVSTDKVDTEIPSPVSGIVRGITVAEDETVAVGAELAVIDEDGAAGDGQVAQQAPAPAPAQPEPYQPQPSYQEQGPPSYQEPATYQPQQQAYTARTQPYQQPAPPYETAAPPPQPAQPTPPAPSAPTAEPPAPAEHIGRHEARVFQFGEPESHAYEPTRHTGAVAQEPAPPAPVATEAAPPEPTADTVVTAESTESPYVTPLVRKLATEHGIDLAALTGTGVGGRIRKQDVLEAARSQRGAEAPAPAQPAPAQPAPAQPVPAQPAAYQPPPTRPTPPPVPIQSAAPAEPVAPPAIVPAPAPPPPTPAPVVPAPQAIAHEVTPSAKRGTTERLSRARQVIAQRMVESLQTSAQLTTVVEADVTAIARLRDRTRAAFEAREGVKLTFLPFFALATVEALKVHPTLNAVIDASNGTVTYHDAEHLGIAVDTERGLMVPVIRNAGDLNIAGLARKIADLAQRTRAGQVSPDDLSGGTFTVTNTGSRGALFDTPIINQPQVGILGTGTVNKRAVVVDDPDLGEVITVRSILYLALTYDHRLVDGADAARFLVTIKNRLEEGAFESELGR
ncbi:MAG TPA: 2-oxo acid dehydrogenase subunit E2 [Streptosporangiaceae bacterium]|nr:2-oxo acid dehydrogenase subunit E2 [Streptosporangiaceae bacterium]